ncbi:hypothetical protein DSC45_03740 [Streptomyces sp. YIM 130001]|uniref:hypothetical protein n=1 Tax=Streptomyces sp. YIM 130001 TaxID=2259644 RepID=UPI000EDA7F0A|nr:hypothetical protein [Streptomyces sp. YIM 130001]RII20314.1 hypothetical protein DSC45_03740 [Streptomyces sp. YIM 130001]
MTPSSRTAAAKTEAKRLPIWVTILAGIAVSFICGEFFHFPYWARLVTVAVAALALEGVNQFVRRRLPSSRHSGLNSPG